MSQEIYLIYDNPTDYESHPSVIGFNLTKEEAEDSVTREKENYLKAKEFFNLMFQWIGEYGVTNPHPNMIPQQSWPKWVPGIAARDITKEMQDERNNIKAANALAEKMNTIAQRNYDEQMIRSLSVKWEKEKETKWFKDYIVVTTTSINNNAHGLVRGNEFFSAICHQL